MPYGKSPGIDGLPAEFYISFWDILGEDLLSVLNSCSHSGQLTFSQRHAVITLLYEIEDPLDPKNWRPISLLCTAY